MKIELRNKRRRWRTVSMMAANFPCKTRNNLNECMYRCNGKVAEVQMWMPKNEFQRIKLTNSHSMNELVVHIFQMLSVEISLFGHCTYADTIFGYYRCCNGRTFIIHSLILFTIHLPPLVCSLLRTQWIRCIGTENTLHTEQQQETLREWTKWTTKRKNQPKHLYFDEKVIRKYIYG